MLREKFNEGACTAVIFLNMSKAYDTVWTTRLIYKLHTAGILDSSLLLLTSYLTDRKFRVTMEGNIFEWKPILGGVPQGAVLAPLLYSTQYM
jgi:hypothetical protein